jgi:hypothetical protein
MHWIVAHKDLAEALSYWATSLGIIIALATGIIAFVKYNRDQRQHEWDRARCSYERFIELAIENPQFGPGYWSSPAAQHPSDRNKFRWFMARFLWACEEVLISVPIDPQMWCDAMRIVIMEHIDFFTDPAIEAEVVCYEAPVRALVEEAIRRARATGVVPPRKGGGPPPPCAMKA